MKLGIIGAMDMEVALLKLQLENAAASSFAGMEFWSGCLRGLPVVVVQSGIGKVNAAICVQLLADRFGVTHILNSGIAGSLDPGLNIGDIVISTEAQYHDVDGAFGSPRGQVPGMDIIAFPADPFMASLVNQLCTAQGISCRMGRIVTGDQFICSRQVKDEIHAACGGLCVEMEGAAVAHAAYRNGLPYLILRAISDKADGSASMDYPTFSDQAAHRSAALTAALAETLSAR